MDLSVGSRMVRFRRVNLRRLVTAAVLAATLIAAPFFSSNVWAAGETLIDGGDVLGIVATDTPIDLSVGGTGDDVINLNLFVEQGVMTMTETTGLTFDGPSTGGNLQFSGTRSDVNAALATLTYTHNDVGVFTIEATLGTGSGEVFNPDNGHVYQVVEAGGGITWNDANAAANAMTYGGASGYLATITSFDENVFVTSRLSNDGWMGASDAAVEGEWRWTGGDEASTQFWSGNGSTGSVVGGAYTNWNGLEPNNSGGNEDCAQILIGSEGRWNDLPCTGTPLLYYVVEFGATGDMPAVQSTDIRVSITGPHYDVSTCEELEAVDDNPASDIWGIITLTADIDCQNQTIESLFQTDAFRGSLLGDNYTIRNVNIESSTSNSAGLFAYTTGPIEVADLTLENITVAGPYDVGTLIGKGDGGFTITNVHARNLLVSSTIDGTAGGLIGDIDVESGYTSVIRNVSAEGVIDASGEYSGDIGGLIGMLEAQSSEITIEEAYADVDITNRDHEGNTPSDVGGLIGEIEVDNDYTGSPVASITIRDTYAWGDIDAPDSRNVGGLFGRVDVEYFDNGDTPDAWIVIESSYARGDVTGFGEVGGLIGHYDEVFEEVGNFYTLRDSFALGQVTSDVDEPTIPRGGLIGDVDGVIADQHTFTNNYFDASGSGQTLCSSDAVIPNCTAVNVDGSDAGYFINNSVNDPLDQWDFTDVWKTQLYSPPVFLDYNLPSADDLNGDGTADDAQQNVGGYSSPVTGKPVAIDVGEACELTTDDMTTESNLAVQDAAYDYANGLWDFEADCGTPGYTTTVTLYYYDVSPDDVVLRKHNPTTGTFFTITDAAISSRTIYGNQVTVVTYDIVDGGDLDVDGLENGVIRDPAGLAELMIGVPNTGLGA